MDKLKQWVAFTALGMILVIVAGWFLLISPKRSEASDVRRQAQSKLAANQVLQSQLAMLKAQSKQLPEKAAALAVVAAKIPDNPALPALIRALDKAAAKTGVELVSMAPAAPTAVAAAAAGQAVTPSAAGTGAVQRAGTAVSSAAAGSLQSIGLSLNVVGGYFQVEQFLDSIESLERALKVTGLTLAPGANPVKVVGSSAALDTGKSLSATITSQVYLAVGRTSSTATAVAPVK